MKPGEEYYDTTIDAIPERAGENEILMIADGFVEDHDAFEGFLARYDMLVARGEVPTYTDGELSERFDRITDCSVPASEGALRAEDVVPCDSEETTETAFAALPLVVQDDSLDWAHAGERRSMSWDEVRHQQWSRLLKRFSGQASDQNRQSTAAWAWAHWGLGVREADGREAGTATITARLLLAVSLFEGARTEMLLRAVEMSSRELELVRDSMALDGKRTKERWFVAANDSLPTPVHARRGQEALPSGYEVTGRRLFSAEAKPLAAPTSRRVSWEAVPERTGVWAQHAPVPRGLPRASNRGLSPVHIPPGVDDHRSAFTDEAGLHVVMLVMPERVERAEGHDQLVVDRMDELQLRWHLTEAQQAPDVVAAVVMSGSRTASSPPVSPPRAAPAGRAAAIMLALPGDLGVERDLTSIRSFVRDVLRRGLATSPQKEPSA
ncbi:hypothetical protein [Streptomyces goshikiensis]|uniref:hypothetical protein n=1 Tax=Streptomyces goshikiensis TaxID=1942 RepID=UPI00367B05D2